MRILVIMIGIHAHNTNEIIHIRIKVITNVLN